MLPALALAAALLGCRESSKPSFLVISLDTLRADRVGRAGPDGASLTPALDGLAAEAASFPSAWSPANETLYAHAALFTGQPASRLGRLDLDAFRLPPDAPTLAARLGQAGWRTEAVAAGGQLSPEMSLDVGFQRYRSMEDWSSLQQTAPVALRALAELAEGDAPFFLLVHGYDAHAPYAKAGPLYRGGAPGYDGPLLAAAADPDLADQLWEGAWYPDFAPSEGASLAEHAGQPGARRVELSAADAAFLRAGYDMAAAHADYWVGALLAGLAASGRAEDTVVIVLGDHGEELLERGQAGHRHALSDETLHVPLILRVPGEPAWIRPEPVSLLDVAPTVLRLAGLAADGPDLRGPLDAERAMYAESALGAVSVRTPRGRLTVPRALAEAGALPAEAPETGYPVLTNAEGEAAPWTEAGPLWAALQGALPR